MKIVKYSKVNLGFHIGLHTDGEIHEFSFDNFGFIQLRIHSLNYQGINLRLISCVYCERIIRLEGFCAMYICS